MSNTSTHSSTRRLTEGGICIALALVLSYLKIPIGLSVCRLAASAARSPL